MKGLLKKALLFALVTLSVVCFVGCNKTNQKTSFAVKFSVDGEVVSEQTVVSGELATLPEEPTKDGYIFKGWFADETFELEFDFETPISQETTVYAKFAKGYDVIFMVNNTIYESQFIEEGEKAIEPENPELDGFVFKKWCVDTSLTFAYDFENPINSATVIYAKMAEAYKVNYADELGNVIFSQNVEINTPPEQPEAPEKEGFKLAGWYLDAELTNKFNFDTPLEEGATLYPKYEKIIVITTANALKQIAEKLDGFYVLGEDINLAGENWIPFENFSGEIDGAGHKIKYFSITSTEETIGFIKVNDGTIKNVVFEDVLFNATATNRTTLKAGIIAGENNGVIEDCQIVNAVCSFTVDKTAGSGDYSYYMGSMIGVNNGTVENCTVESGVSGNFISYNNYGSSWSSTTIYVRFRLGGVVGYNAGTFKNVDVTTHISSWAKINGNSHYSGSGSTRGYVEIGGFVSHNVGGIIEDCSLEYSIDATDSDCNSYGSVYNWLGGFVRVNSSGGEINRCYAVGSITESGSKATDVHIGGFVQNNSEMIKDCYADCQIQSARPGTSIGGFAGLSLKTISSCYAVVKITTNNTTDVGGFVGRNETGSTINGCVVEAEITYTTATNVGHFVGETQSGAWYEKSYYSTSSKIICVDTEVEYEETALGLSSASREDLFSKALLVTELRWNEDIWNIDGTNEPTLKD